MCRFDPGATVTASWTLRVPSYCPTFNSIGKNTKNNFRYRGWRKVWEKEFGPWLQTIPPAMKYRRVTITRYYAGRNRAYDHQNFAGGCKPLLDVIVTFGGLYDDRDLWCEAHYVQIKAGSDGVDVIEVKIEELS